MIMRNNFDHEVDQASFEWDLQDYNYSKDLGDPDFEDIMEMSEIEYLAYTLSRKTK